MPKHFPGHSRGSPWRDVAGGNDARVGKARLCGHAGTALKYRDLVTLDGQLKGGGHADDAGTNYGYLHLQAPAAP